MMQRRNTRSSRAYTAALLACLSLSACAAPVDSATDPAEIAGLDAKADSELRLSVATPEPFRIPCDLDRCRFQLILDTEESIEGLALVTGTLQDVTRLREDLAAGTPPPPDTPELRELVADDAPAGTVSTYLNVGRGESFGLIFDLGGAKADAVSAVLRLVPDFEAATKLLPNDDGSVEVYGFVDDSTQAWWVPVPDEPNGSNPMIEVALDGYIQLFDLATYYQCTSDGSVQDGGKTDLHIRYQVDAFEVDCPTIDDGGRVYVEVTGSGAYTLTISYE